MNLLLALLFLGSVLTANGSVKFNVTRSDFPDGTTLIIARSSFNDSKLAYAYCDKSYGDPKVHCTVYLDSLEGGSFSCRITLQSKMTNGDIKANRERAQVLPFGSGDNVLFIWQELPRLSGGTEMAYLKFSTIRMSDCNVNETEVRFNDSDRNRALLSGVLSSTDTIVVKDAYDRYSVLYDDQKGCGFLKFCKVELDGKGNVVSTPESGMEDKEIYMPGAVIRLPSRERYVAVYGSLDNHELRIHGSWEDDNSNDIIRSMGSITGYSLTSKGISACFVTQLEATCIQRVNGSIPSNYYHIPLEQRPLSVIPFNLPEGGLLVLSVECTAPEYERGCSSGPGSEVYRVIKMSENGKMVGSLKLDSIVCNRSKPYATFSHFFVNKNGEECIVRACFHDARYFNEPPMLDRFINCWTKL